MTNQIPNRVILPRKAVATLLAGPAHPGYRRVAAEARHKAKIVAKMPEPALDPNEQATDTQRRAAVAVIDTLLDRLRDIAPALPEGDRIKAERAKKMLKEAREEVVGKIKPVLSYPDALTARNGLRFALAPLTAMITKLGEDAPDEVVNAESMLAGIAQGR